MKNISFDNPYLLLIMIPVALAIVIPYFICVSKDNKTLGWKLSLGLHIAMVITIGLALAGLRSVSVLTKTTVYVLADVSDSSARNLDEIDAYIAEIKKELPDNSRLGIVCFGKDYVVLTPEGRKIKSVSEANVDGSATDVAAALNYAGTLFKGDSIKRIVLITDGNDTVTRDTGAVASAVERLTEVDIKIDTIFLDNSLKEGETEMQLSNAEFTESVYLGNENQVKLLVQSSADANAIVELWTRPLAEQEKDAVDYERIEGADVSVSLESGLNTVTMHLPSDEAGVFEYMAVLTGEGDISDKNNAVYFTQTVEGQMQVLMVTGERADVRFVEGLYGDDAVIESHVVTSGYRGVPFTVEALTQYDEIVISNLDIREINNVNAFVDSLDIVVSQYGKSLITFGDLYLQNDKDDPIFLKFAELLPVTYGTANNAGRMYTFVIDVSHSMFYGSKYATAKEAALKLLSILDDEDYVCVITFSGEIKALQSPEKLKACKSDLITKIQNLTYSHSSDIGGGLERAFREISEMGLNENQVMLISDGLSFSNRYDAEDEAQKLRDKGAVISTINIYSSGTNAGSANNATMHNVASIGGGSCYSLRGGSTNVDSVVFGEVAEDVADSIVRKQSNVYIEKYKDGVVDGFTSFADVSAFIQSVAKYDATVPLTIEYNKALSGRVPLYAYRAHGNGKVSSLTTSVSNDWTSLWTEGVKTSLFENIFKENTPSKKVDYPFTLTVEHDEYEAYVEIVPSAPDPEAVVTVKITVPDENAKNGRKTVTRTLAFDSKKYFYTFEIGDVGAYAISVTYSYDDGEYEFTAESYFNISYLPEYDAYTSFDTAKIYDFMRGNGSINVGEIPDLENDEREVSTYKVSYQIPLLIVAVVLFVLDIIVRKFKFADKRFKKAEKVKESKEKAKGGIA